METSESVSLDPTRTNIVLGFINLGFKDYIAARTLLNEGIGKQGHLGLQGSVLASTAVEKYFKAIVAGWGKPRKWHLDKILLAEVEKRGGNLHAKLNHSFLEFLMRCYTLRYFDTLEPGFTLHISSRQVLAELDFTISEVQRRFIFKRKDGRSTETPFDTYVESRHPLLWKNNYVLQKTDRKALVEQRDSIYGMRLDEMMGLMEVFYDTDESKDDGDFLKPGLTPGKPA